MALQGNERSFYRYICYYTTYVVRYKLEKGGGQQRSKKAPLASSPPVINSRQEKKETLVKKERSLYDYVQNCQEQIGVVSFKVFNSDKDTRVNYHIEQGLNICSLNRS